MMLAYNGKTKSWHFSELIFSAHIYICFDERGAEQCSLLRKVVCWVCGRKECCRFYVDS